MKIIEYLQSMSRRRQTIPPVGRASGGLRHVTKRVATMLVAATTLSSTYAATTAIRTEDFLNTLGVNTHVDGNSGWDTNTTQVGQHLAYIGVRLDRDWAGSTTGANWAAVQSAWNPLGRFWASVAEASPAGQRSALGYTESQYTTYPNLIYAIGGPNEEDDPAPRSWGATLADSALVQNSLYSWAHSSGRDVPVSQMEFGWGWTALNSWQGDYNPGNLGQYYLNNTYAKTYTPGSADIGGAHTYISSTSQTPLHVLNQLRPLALLTTPGKPVAHTEFGDYNQNTTAAWAQYAVMGAFDSAAAGDVAYVIYGLQDGNGTMGFYNSTDTTANPVANSYHTMTTLLASPVGQYAPGAPPTYDPSSLNITYTNNATVSHLLLQKYSGEFVIAEWSEQLASGVHNDSDTITLGQTFPTVTVYDVTTGTTPIATYHYVSQVTLGSMTGNDTYLIIASAVPYGHKVALKDVNTGFYVTTDTSWGDILMANTATTITTNETYYVYNSGVNGMIGLKSAASGFYATNELTGNNILQALSATTIGANEKYYWIPQSNGTIALFSNANGKYVSTDTAYYDMMQASHATLVTTLEQFNWTDLGAY